MINNYIRFMEKGPRAVIEHIVCFDSYNPDDIARVEIELKQRPKTKPVIWARVKPFEHLAEVGQNSGLVNEPS